MEQEQISLKDSQIIQQLKAENTSLKEQLRKRQLDINKTNSYYLGKVRKLSKKIEKLKQTL